MTYNELCKAILTAQEEMLKHKIEANSVTLNGRKYGMLIEDCPHNMKPTIFGMTVKADYALPDDYDFLVQYEPPQLQTNADRIRAMSDEEMASLFGVWVADCDNNDVPCKEHCSYYKSCGDAWLAWLKEEVKDD